MDERKHVHSDTEVVLKRLTNVIGRLKETKNMVNKGEDCSEVLIELAKVKSAINVTGKMILKDHIVHCIVEAVESGDHKTVEELNKAISQFVK